MPILFTSGRSSVPTNPAPPPLSDLSDYDILSEEEEFSDLASVSNHTTDVDLSEIDNDNQIESEATSSSLSVITGSEWEFSPGCDVDVVIPKYAVSDSITESTTGSKSKNSSVSDPGSKAQAADVSGKENCCESAAERCTPNTGACTTEGGKADSIGIMGSTLRSFGLVYPEFIASNINVGEMCDHKVKLNHVAKQTACDALKREPCIIRLVGCTNAENAQKLLLSLYNSLRETNLASEIHLHWVKPDLDCSTLKHSTLRRMNVPTHSSFFSSEISLESVTDDEITYNIAEKKSGMSTSNHHSCRVFNFMVYGDSDASPLHELGRLRKSLGANNPSLLIPLSVEDLDTASPSAENITFSIDAPLVLAKRKLDGIAVTIPFSLKSLALLKFPWENVYDFYLCNGENVHNTHCANSPWTTMSMENQRESPLSARLHKKVKSTIRNDKYGITRTILALVLIYLFFSVLTGYHNVQMQQDAVNERFQNSIDDLLAQSGKNGIDIPKEYHNPSKRIGLQAHADHLGAVRSFISQQYGNLAEKDHSVEKKKDTKLSCSGKSCNCGCKTTPCACTHKAKGAYSESLQAYGSKATNMLRTYGDKLHTFAKRSLRKLHEAYLRFQSESEAIMEALKSNIKKDKSFALKWLDETEAAFSRGFTRWINKIGDSQSQRRSQFRNSFRGFWPSLKSAPKHKHKSFSWPWKHEEAPPVKGWFGIRKFGR